MDIQNKRHGRPWIYVFGIGVILMLVAIWVGAVTWKNQREGQQEIKSDGYGQEWVNQTADSAAPSHQETDAENQITTPEGFKIISYSDKWPTERLNEVYEELMKNTHGDEIEYLEYVVLYPQQETLQSEYEKLGSQSSMEKTYHIRLNLPFIVGHNFTYDIERTASVIKIYNMDAFDSIEDALDPETNVTYGAKFLRNLYEQKRDWIKAAMAYHSSVPTKAQRYKRNYKHKQQNAAAEEKQCIEIYIKSIK